MSTIVFIAAIIRLLSIDIKTDVSYFHFLYESTFGPVSAVLAVFSFFITLKASKYFSGGTVGAGLQLIALGMLFIALGMFAFGMHGWGLLGGEEMRYILRSSVFISSIIMFYGSYKILKGVETIK